MIKTKYVAILFLLCFSEVFVYGAKGEERIRTTDHNVNLKDYVLMSLKVSTASFKKIECEIAKAKSDYLYARQKGDSEFSLKKASIYLEKMKNNRMDKRLERMIESVSCYFSFLQAEQSLKEKEGQLSINLKEEEIAKRRFTEGLKEENEYAEQKEITLESRIAVLKAKNVYIGMYRKFLRRIGVEYTGKNHIFPEERVSFVPVVKIDFKECVKRAERVNSSCMYNLKMYELYKSYNNKIISSNAVTVKEKNYLKIRMVSYKADYEEAKISLENKIWTLVTRNNTSSALLKLKKVQVEMAKKQREIKKIEYVNGTVFKTEVLQAALTYKEALDSLIEEKESVLLNYLKIVMFERRDLLLLWKDH